MAGDTQVNAKERAAAPERFAMPPDPVSFADPISVGQDVIHIIHPPRDRMEAIEHLCAGARESVRVVLYMIADDHCGGRIRAALIAAARRGIAVTALFDTFGSNEIKPEFLDPLREAGARVGLFNARRSLRYLIRNHQKIYVADGARAIIGGFNGTDHYFGCMGEQSWEDLGITIAGPTAARLADYCDALYRIALDGQPRFRAVRRLVRQWKVTPGDDVCILLGGPIKRLNPWARSLKNDLQTAARADIVSAYFSPGRAITKRIDGVARRGEARLVLAGKTDNMATIGAARFLYNGLLRAGAKIFEFQPCMLHMKLIVVDDIVYIGSANMDARSLFINLEIMLRIESAELAGRMRELVDTMVAHSEPQTRTLHRSRGGWFTRMRWALAYFAVNTVDYTVSRKANFGITA